MSNEPRNMRNESNSKIKESSTRTSYLVPRTSKIVTFKDLNAWKEGHELVLMTYRLTKRFPKDELFALTSQMRRAAVSITSNIAEGFGRSGVNDRAHFYTIAHGSVTELQNQLLVSRDVGYISDVEFENVEIQSVIVHKILTGLIRATKARAQEI